jgi:hypothetical protein
MTLRIKMTLILKYDQYVGSQVRVVPIGDEIRTGTVLRCNSELDGTVKG